MINFDLLPPGALIYADPGERKAGITPVWATTLFTTTNDDFRNDRLGDLRDGDPAIFLGDTHDIFVYVLTRFGPGYMYRGRLRRRR